jgi:hypothetical protein
MNVELPEGFKIKRVHLHVCNSSDEQRMEAVKGILKTTHVPKYVTISSVVDSDNNCVAKGLAVCSSQDSPSRKRGRLIADGRALAHFREVQ